MTFRIHALDPAPFAPLFALDEAALAAHRALRMTSGADTGWPCRISLRDAPKGTPLLLVNHAYLDAASPYRGTHAIFVGQGAARAHPETGEVPDMLASRLVSVRAFDAAGMMLDAEVTEGRALGPLLADWCARDTTARVCIHTARQGCFLAEARTS